MRTASEREGFRKLYVLWYVSMRLRIWQSDSVRGAGLFNEVFALRPEAVDVGNEK